MNAERFAFVAFSNVTLVANFVPIYLITATNQPVDGGSVLGSGTYTNGQPVTLVAMPDSCYLFGACTVSDIVVSMTTNFTFAATSNETVSATFVPKYYDVATAGLPSGDGITSGGGTFPCGSIVDISATPNGGYKFLNWTEDSSVVGTSPNLALVATQNTTVVANFIPTNSTQLLPIVLSEPKITGDKSGFIFQLDGSPGTHFALQTTSNLFDWSNVTISNIPNSGSMVFSNATMGSVTRFYRIQY